MTTTLGSGEFCYEVIENWAKLPDGWTLRDVAAGAVDLLGLKRRRCSISGISGA
jgi:hypothetical protein